MSIKGVIFDLDGTLVDTLDDLTDSMNTALQQVGRPPRPRQECMAMIGHGLRKFAERALGDGYLDLTEALLERMVAYYKDHCVLKTVPYPGIEELIQNLMAKGIRLGVLTNKNQTPSEIIVRHFFADVFDPIVGAAPHRVPKPDSASLLEIIAQWQLSKEEVMFVGDSETDIQTAANAGLQCIACQWGFRSTQQLIEAGAPMMADHPSRILTMIS